MIAMVATPGLVTQASLTGPAPSGAPVGVATTPAVDWIAGMPTHGGSFAILTTGSAAGSLRHADHPGYVQPQSAVSGAGTTNGGHDVVELTLTLDVPSGVNCLEFDYRFMTDEPLGDDAVADGFVALLDAPPLWSVDVSTLDDSGSLALDDGGAPMSATQASLVNTAADTQWATTYDWDAGLRTVRAPITPGAHSLYFAVFEAVDTAVDSAVFLDRLMVVYDATGACGEVNEPPVADVSVQPAYTNLGRPVRFDGSTSYDPDGGALVYSWRSEAATGPELATGAVFDTSFDAVGVSCLHLVVTDDFGHRDTAAACVEITDELQVGIDISGEQTTTAATILSTSVHYVDGGAVVGEPVQLLLTYRSGVDAVDALLPPCATLWTALLVTNESGQASVQVPPLAQRCGGPDEPMQAPSEPLGGNYQVRIEAFTPEGNTGTAIATFDITLV